MRRTIENPLMTTTGPFIERAAALIDRFSVIPIEPSGKRPPQGIGAKQATRDGAQIIEWAERFPEANVAIVADNEICIVETDDFERFAAAIRNGTGKELPETLTACGSSENRPHFFFKQTEKTRNIGNLQVPGLFECRWSNQYVVAPPSIHPNGAVYRWLNDAEIIPIPDWFTSELARLAITQKNERKNPTVQADGRIPEGSRHYFRMQELGRAWDGTKSEAEMIALAMELNERCDPPDAAAKVIGEVRDIMKREPFNPGPTLIIGNSEPNGNKAESPIGPTRPRRKREPFIIPRRDESRNYGHWFPRGTISLAAGASGMGKTVLLSHLAENLRLGNPIFEHPPVVAEYAFVLVDRTRKELGESVEGKGLADSEILSRAVEIDLLEETPPAQQLDTALKGWEQAGRVPDLVIIEGADLWCSEASDMKKSVRFLKGLIAVATAWDIAVIASVGSPKQKPKEEYALTRDKVFGSIAWGRTCSTILHIALTDPEDPDSCRKVQVLPRTGRSERFYFEFRDGRLMFSDSPPAEPTKVAREPAGVADTRNADPDADLIGYLEALPAGTVLQLRRLHFFGSPNTIAARLARLSHPGTGWVTKNERGTFVVRDRCVIEQAPTRHVQ